MTKAVGPSPAAVPERATRAGKIHEASLPHQEWFSYSRLQAGVGIPGEDLHLPGQLRSQAHDTGFRRYDEDLALLEDEWNSDPSG
jgi:hypothetical protein